MSNCKALFAAFDEEGWPIQDCNHIYRVLVEAVPNSIAHLTIIGAACLESATVYDIVRANPQLLSFTLSKCDSLVDTYKLRLWAKEHAPQLTLLLTEEVVRFFALSIMFLRNY